MEGKEGRKHERRKGVREEAGRKGKWIESKDERKGNEST